MGSFITNAAVYGKPDVGLITATEMVSQARNITGSVQIPFLLMPTPAMEISSM